MSHCYFELKMAIPEGVINTPSKMEDLEKEVMDICSYIANRLKSSPLTFVDVAGDAMVMEAELFDILAKIALVNSREMLIPGDGTMH